MCFYICKCPQMRLFIPGGIHMLRHTEMCCPNGSLFHQKSLHKNPILVQKKILRRGVPLHKNCKNIEKSAIFEVEKPLEMGPDLWQFRKTQSNQTFFEGEESLDMGRGFKPWVTHPVKKQFKYPLLVIYMLAHFEPCTHFQLGTSTVHLLGAGWWK